MMHNFANYSLEKVSMTFKNRNDILYSIALDQTQFESLFRYFVKKKSSRIKFAESIHP